MSNFIFKCINAASAPKAVGPYSSAVQVNNTLYLSGVIGIDKTTNKLVSGGILNETQQAFNNAKAILEEVGSSLDKVASVKVYLAKISDSPTVNEIYLKYMKPPYPTRCLMEVGKLPLMCY